MACNVTAELRPQGIASRALQAVLSWAAQQIGPRRAAMSPDGRPKGKPSADPSRQSPVMAMFPPLTCRAMAGSGAHAPVGGRDDRRDSLRSLDLDY